MANAADAGIVDDLDLISPGGNVRPTRDEYFLSMAQLAATRSTCLSRQVGCILVSERNHVLATGYNGPASGLSHCTQCNRTPGNDLDKCPATHAEQNALLQCHDVYQISTVYCTDSPCIHCVKLLLNTSAQRIVFSKQYPHHWSQALWESVGRRWSCLR